MQISLWHNIRGHNKMLDHPSIQLLLVSKCL